MYVKCKYVLMSHRICAVVKKNPENCFIIIIVVTFCNLSERRPKRETSGQLIKPQNLPVPACVQIPIPRLEDKIIGVHANTVLQSIKASR